ncbi:MerR family transcriptional regulator [Martelella radicis]|uniref:DNA-binding transcriptional MerR regulator n=1 Tax=Martelella radicis TaxID=1397476 RepID=A0A7W6KJC5_9HYPH|nr:MerR family transcriptional regulator [Martelella radicis]MBB4122399.1 DNA-binding transcriptional MerR regulator [Martelella radicis]
MLISEFSDKTGLPRDTIHFYIKRGLLQPEQGLKGGSNPYRIFSESDVAMARFIRVAQSLGMSLRQIAALNEEERKSGITPERAKEIQRSILQELEDKKLALDGMTAYVTDKMTWMREGRQGPPPDFLDYALVRAPVSGEGLRSSGLPLNGDGDKLKR